MSNPLRDIPAPVMGERERMARRAAARRRQLQRRRRLGGGAILVVVAAIALAAGLGGSSGREGRAPHSAAQHTKPIVPGGPLAPARFGGLAALWAPQNVVGTQPGTAAAYEAASSLPGLPGDLMIADRGNNRILVVTPAKERIFAYPGPGDRGSLYFDDDTFIEPGGRYIISNEEENSDVVRVGIADRSQTTLFGHRREPGGDATHVRSPDDAYMLPDGTFTVADADNCRILFVRAGVITRRYGHSGICRHEPPAYFTQVNGDTPMPDGGVMVSEIQGSWVDAIGPDGRLEWSVKAPVAYPSDPQPLPGNRVLLADYSNPGHLIIMTRRGRVLWRYGPAEGFGRLDHPSLAMGLPNGDVAVNDDYRHRVLIINPRTNRIVWRYGHTDQPGTAPGYLNTPDGMDFIPAAPGGGGPDYAAVVHP